MPNRNRETMRRMKEDVSGLTLKILDQKKMGTPYLAVYPARIPGGLMQEPVLTLQHKLGISQ